MCTSPKIFPLQRQTLLFLVVLVISIIKDILKALAVSVSYEVHWYIFQCIIMLPMCIENLPLSIIPVASLFDIDTDTVAMGGMPSKIANQIFW